MITIVDYGMGNLGSIRNMLKKLGTPALITSSAEEILRSRKLILPGVGAFDNAMTNLRERELIEALNVVALERKIPVLGICLGMQLLSRSSEEGRLQGLGWIAADTKRFRFETGVQQLKIPHMGWNSVRVVQERPLVKDLYPESRYYFVHSYHVVCDRPENELLRTTYGSEFTSAVCHENIYGAQFHPEKSHKFGLQLLGNFVNFCS